MQQGLRLVAEVLLRPGDGVWVDLARLPAGVEARLTEAAERLGREARRDFTSASVRSGSR